MANQKLNQFHEVLGLVFNFLLVSFENELKFLILISINQVVFIVIYNHVRHHMVVLVQQRHLQLAIRGDEELDTLIKATIAGGGVIPHIHKVCLFEMISFIIRISFVFSHSLERKHLFKEVYLKQVLKQMCNKITTRIYCTGFTHIYIYILFFFFVVYCV